MISYNEWKHLWPEHRNKEGGFEPKTNEQKSKWKKVDLITLPEEVKGTNCFNCKFIAKKEGNVGYCTHKDVQEWVTSKMCCALWDHSNVKRSYD